MSSLMTNHTLGSTPAATPLVPHGEPLSVGALRLMRDLATEFAQGVPAGPAPLTCTSRSTREPKGALANTVDVHGPELLMGPIVFASGSGDHILRGDRLHRLPAPPFDLVRTALAVSVGSVS